MRGPLLEPAHLRLEPGIDAIPATEEACPDALLGEVGELAVDRLGEDLHQVGDLRVGP